jgi:glycosyltransferase involved in cell wall biosynthesis
MVITFVVPTRTRPMGGSIALYEFANGLRRRGHEVSVVHLDPLTFMRLRGHDLDGWPVDPDNYVRSLEDMPWFRFEENIRHWFPEQHQLRDLPDADFVFNAGWGTKESGLPLVVIQGYRMWPKEFEYRDYHSPYPKICVAKWLVDVGKRLGVPEHELVHVPCGINHEKYRLVSPIEGRPPVVSMLYSDHPSKAPSAGLAVLARAKTSLPETETVVFSRARPVHAIPAWMTFLRDPPQEVIVREIYNRSRIFLCPSRVEGFGLMCLEAMACGAALVTTSNGGSDDYAIQGETALVCDADDVTSLAEGVESLLRDDSRRIALAKQGNEYVRKTFGWDLSAERLEAFLNAYAREPDRYLRQPAEPH